MFVWQFIGLDNLFKDQKRGLQFQKLLGMDRLIGKSYRITRKHWNKTYSSRLRFLLNYDFVMHLSQSDNQKTLK